MARVFVEGVRKWNCVECGWTTSNNLVSSCPDCTGSMLIIPLNLDNNLFIIVDDVITYFYKLDMALTENEDGIELLSVNGEKVAVIRNWSDFREFFGNYFCRMYDVKEEEINGKN